MQMGNVKMCNHRFSKYPNQMNMLGVKDNNQTTTGDEHSTFHKSAFTV